MAASVSAAVEALDLGDHLAGGGIADVHGVIFADGGLLVHNRAPTACRPRPVAGPPVQCGTVPEPPATPSVQFNLAKAFDTLVETLADRECIVWRDRRLTYAQVTERSRRLAAYLHGRGLGVHRERAELQGRESGQDHVALALYNGNEYLEGMLGSYRARVAPFNVNYRYVGEELRYLLNDARPRAMILHSSLAPTLAEVLPTLDRPPTCCSRSPTNRATPSSPGRSGTRRRWPPPRPRAHRSSRRPTTSTSSTRGAPRACPRACCGASTTSSWPPWAGGRSAPGRS